MDDKPTHYCAISISRAVKPSQDLELRVDALIKTWKTLERPKGAEWSVIHFECEGEDLTLAINNTETLNPETGLLDIPALVMTDTEFFQTFMWQHKLAPHRKED